MAPFPMNTLSAETVDQDHVVLADDYPAGR